jgi:hypothetical protein
MTTIRKTVVGSSANGSSSESIVCVAARSWPPIRVWAADLSITEVVALFPWKCEAIIEPGGTQTALRAAAHRFARTNR